MGELTLIFKIAGIGLLISVINEVLGIYGNKNMSTFITMAGVAIVAGMVLAKVSQLFDTVVNTFRLY